MIISLLIGLVFLVIGKSTVKINIHSKYNKMNLNIE